MALEQISLRKLLQILFLDTKQQISAIRKDIQDDIRKRRPKKTGRKSSGGDFYGPFWSDAREHILDISDLHVSVKDRIASNFRRKELYPRLRDGFLLWWNQRRRWTNAPFQLGERATSRFSMPGMSAVVKIDSILSVKDSLGTERLVYPYFSPHPALSDHSARLGLWLLVSALPTVPVNAIRILDVIRGQTFSLDRNPLRGDEREDMRMKYTELLRVRDDLRKQKK